MFVCLILIRQAYQVDLLKTWLKQFIQKLNKSMDTDPV